MLFMGERERDQLHGNKIMSQIADKIYGNLPPSKYFLEIRGASHFSFNNRFAENFGARLLSGTEEQFDVIHRYAIALFEKYAAGKKDCNAVLERRDDLLTRYAKELQP